MNNKKEDETIKLCIIACITTAIIGGIMVLFGEKVTIFHGVVIYSLTLISFKTNNL